MVVTEVNESPVFAGTPASQNVAEHAALTVTNGAVDADVPANVLTYSLLDAPAGAEVDVNGVITWTPGEAQGPGTNVITTVVSDGELSATNSFEVVVTEVNESPVFAGTPANQSVAEHAALTVTNGAVDADVPANVLSYTLENAPAGAVVDTNGVISWTPLRRR